MFFKALWLCCLSVRSFPNKLRAHSSIRSDLFMEEIWMSSSSSFVRRKCCRSSITDTSILLKVEGKGKVRRVGVWGIRKGKTLKREGERLGETERESS